MTSKKYTGWVAVQLVVEQPATETERERSAVWESLRNAVSGLDLANRLQQSFNERAFATDFRTSEIVVRVVNIEIDDVDHPSDLTSI
jgi:hypothetical protein